MHKQKKMGKLLLIVITVFVPSFEISAQSRIRSNKILEGNWAYKTLITSGKEQNLEKKNECGFREGLAIIKSTEVQRLEFGALQFKGHQIGVSDEKVCITDPVTLQPVVSINACETTWIRLHDQPNKFLRVRQSSIVEYSIEMLNKKSMLLLKVREIYNDGSEAPEKLNWNGWIERGCDNFRPLTVQTKSGQYTAEDERPCIFCGVLPVLFWIAPILAYTHSIPIQPHL